MPIKDTDTHQAATTIQKTWRGSMVRRQKLLETPSTPAVDYNAFIISNEKLIDFPQAQKFSHGQFALIGCSTLKNIEILLNMMNWYEYQGSVDAFTNIPKLFIVDNSAQVISFWQTLKSCFIRNKTLDEFFNDVKHEEGFNACYPSKDVSTGKLIENELSYLLLCPMHYYFIQSVMAKATIIQGSYLDSNTFEYLAEHTRGMPAVVYASNIAEFVNIPTGRVRTDNLYESQLNQFLDNLYRLNLVASIHSRTTLKMFSNTLGGIRPDQNILAFNKTKTELRALLTAPNLVNILGENSRLQIERYLTRQADLQRQQQAETQRKEQADRHESSFAGLKKGFLDQKSRKTIKKKPTTKRDTRTRSQVNSSKRPADNMFSGLQSGFFSTPSTSNQTCVKTAARPKRVEAAASTKPVLKPRRTKQTYAGFQPGFLLAKASKPSECQDSTSSADEPASSLDHQEATPPVYRRRTRLSTKWLSIFTPVA